MFTDFDGTLSHIISDPQAVQPVEGAVSQLNRLAEQCGRVAVVSGRPVSFLGQFFEPPIELSGLYGIEHRAGSIRTVDPTALEWTSVLATVAADAAHWFGAANVEDKTYSLTVHYRGASADTAAKVEQWAEGVATHHGLHARSAKMSVEIHPPLDRDKGDAIRDMLDGLTAAVYFGDDAGDRSGFERLLAAKTDGVLQAIAAVLVDGPETPNNLAEAVTDIVATPEEVVGLLETLGEASSA